MPPPRESRQGWTLIELVVVVAIVGVLAGLVLSAVAKVRANGLRAACSNNLRQIALAAQQYHDTELTLPPGLTLHHPTLKQDYLSWSARLLPFLEQDAGWSRTVQAFRQDPIFLDRPPHTVATIVLPVYGCPADPRVRRPSNFGPGLTSYLGVVGVDQNTPNGVLFLNSGVSFRDITDGTSTTLLVGERPPNWDTELGWWYAGMGQDKLGSADVYLGVRELMVYYKYFSDCRRGPYQFTDGRLNDPCAAFHFWSLHPGGAHFAFCDGSVRFLSYTANSVLPALASRDGGEAVEAP